MYDDTIPVTTWSYEKLTFDFEELGATYCSLDFEHIVLSFPDTDTRDNAFRILQNERHEVVKFEDNVTNDLFIRVMYPQTITITYEDGSKHVYLKKFITEYMAYDTLTEEGDGSMCAELKHPHQIYKFATGDEHCIHELCDYKL